MIISKRSSAKQLMQLNKLQKYLKDFKNKALDGVERLLSKLFSKI